MSDDDAAGAVRRTPRPARDDLINQTAQCIIDTYAQYAPVPGVLHSEAGNIACALADAGLLADPEQRLTLDTTAARLNIVRAERDLAVWLHAESEHHRAWLLKSAELELASHGQAEDKLQARIAELESSIGYWKTRLGEDVAERQARIDAALALMDYWDAHGGSIPQGHRLRAALHRDQPTEPDERLAGLARPAEGVQLIADAFGIAAAEAAAQLRDAIRAAARSDLAEPTGEADRG